MLHHKVGKLPGRVARPDRGQVIVLAAIAMTGILGLTALTTDVGMLWTTRRHMQTAADAAAIAASRALTEGASLATAANAVATLDGFANGASGVTVTVNNPPSSGAYAGNASYVETIVQQAAPTYFLQVLGYTTVNVSARAVSGGVNSSSCLYSLDPSSPGAFSFTGSGSITSGCGTLVNSSSSSALTFTGSGSINESSIGVVGNYSKKGSGSISPTPITGIAPVGDPLASLKAPTVGSCTYIGKTITGSGSATLSPGTYCNGITVKGSGSVTFNSGTYILLGGGLTAKGSGSLSGTSVTFYNTYNSTYPYGGIDLSGSGSLNFSAPTSGSLAGILIFQDRSVPVGSAASKFNGSG
ncbi:MAG: pilus assembly protein TadG-related protein, partial [Candidatus Binataceae bacterium]